MICSVSRPVIPLPPKKSWIWTQHFQSKSPELLLRSQAIAMFQYLSNLPHIFYEFCRLSVWGDTSRIYASTLMYPSLSTCPTQHRPLDSPPSLSYFEMAFLLCISLGRTRIMTKAWDASISCFQPYARIGPQKALSWPAGCCIIQFIIDIWTLLATSSETDLLPDWILETSFESRGFIVIISFSKLMPG
jgi:hypothetical protein